MVYYLVFRDTLFIEAEQSDIKEEDLAVLAIDGTTSTLYFHEAIPMIEKLTAQRQANSIAKSGFLLSSNQRVGLNSNLKVVVGSLPTISTIPSPKFDETPVVKPKHDEPDLVEEPTQIEKQVTPASLNDAIKEVTETIEAQSQSVEHESVSETYDRPIRFTVDKSESESEREHPDTPVIVENITVPDLKSENSSDKLSIQEILSEEKEKALTELAQDEKANPARTYDELIEYFWKELFGQVYSSWD